MPASLSTIRDGLLDAISALTTGGVKSYSIDGRQVTKLDLPDLLASYERINAHIRRTSRADNGVRHAEFNDATEGKRFDGRV